MSKQNPADIVKRIIGSQPANRANSAPRAAKPKPPAEPSWVQALRTLNINPNITQGTPPRPAGTHTAGNPVIEALNTAIQKNRKPDPLTARTRTAASGKVVRMPSGRSYVIQGEVTQEKIDQTAAYDEYIEQRQRAALARTNPAEFLQRQMGKPSVQDPVADYIINEKVKQEGPNELYIQRKAEEARRVLDMSPQDRFVYDWLRRRRRADSLDALFQPSRRAAQEGHTDEFSYLSNEELSQLVRDYWSNFSGRNKGVFPRDTPDMRFLQRMVNTLRERSFVHQTPLALPDWLVNAATDFEIMTHSNTQEDGAVTPGERIGAGVNFGTAVLGSLTLGKKDLVIDPVWAGLKWAWGTGKRAVDAARLASAAKKAGVSKQALKKVLANGPQTEREAQILVDAGVLREAPKPEPVRTPEPPAPKPEPAAETKPAPKTRTRRKPEPQPEALPKAEVQPEPRPKVEPEPQTKAEPEPQTKAQPEPQAKQKTAPRLWEKEEFEQADIGNVQSAIGKWKRDLSVAKRLLDRAQKAGDDEAAAIQSLRIEIFKENIHRAENDIRRRVGGRQTKRRSSLPDKKTAEQAREELQQIYDAQAGVKQADSAVSEPRTAPQEASATPDTPPAKEAPEKASEAVSGQTPASRPEPVLELVETPPAKPKRKTSPKGSAKETKAVAEPVAKPEVEAKVEVKAKPKPKAEAEPKPKTKAEAEPKPETKPKAKPKTGPKAETKAEPQPKPKAEPEAKPEAKPGRAPKPALDDTALNILRRGVAPDSPKAVQAPEVKPEPKPEVKPKPKPEVKPEPKPEAKVETKPAEKPKPEAKVEAKPEAKPQAKGPIETPRQLADRISALLEKERAILRAIEKGLQSKTPQETIATLEAQAKRVRNEIDKLRNGQDAFLRARNQRVVEAVVKAVGLPESDTAVRGAINRTIADAMGDETVAELADRAIQALAKSKKQTAKKKAADALKKIGKDLTEPSDKIGANAGLENLAKAMKNAPEFVRAASEVVYWAVMETSSLARGATVRSVLKLIGEEYGDDIARQIQPYAADMIRLAKRAAKEEKGAEGIVEAVAKAGESKPLKQVAEQDELMSAIAEDVKVMAKDADEEIYGVARRLRHIETPKALVMSPREYAQRGEELWQKHGIEGVRKIREKLVVGDLVDTDDVVLLSRYIAKLRSERAAGALEGISISGQTVPMEDALMTAYQMATQIGGRWANLGRAMQAAFTRDYSPTSISRLVRIAAERGGTPAKQAEEFVQAAEVLAKRHEALEKRIAELTEELEQARKSTPEPTVRKKRATNDRIKQIESEQKKILESIHRKLASAFSGIPPELFGDIARLVKLEFEKGGITLREAAGRARALLAENGLRYDTEDIVDVASGYKRPPDSQKPPTRFQIARKEARLESMARDLKAGKELPQSPKPEPESPKIAKLQKKVSTLKKEVKLRKEVKELEAGKQPEPKPRPKPESAKIAKLQQKATNLKKEAKLRKEIQDLKEGKPPAPKPEPKPEPKKIAKLRKEVSTLKKEARLSQVVKELKSGKRPEPKPKPKPETPKIAGLQKEIAILRKEAKLRAQIQELKSGKRPERKPKAPPETPEIARLQEELEALRARYRKQFNAAEWEKRTLDRVNEDIATYQKWIEENKALPPEERAPLPLKKTRSRMQISEELSTAYKERTRLRRQMDRMVADAQNPPGLIAKFTRYHREFQLANLYARMRDVKSNLGNVVKPLVGSTGDAIAKAILRIAKQDPAMVSVGAVSPKYHAQKLQYVMRGAKARWGAEIADALKGYDDFIGMKYDNTGYISRFAGALDAPFRDFHQRMFAYDIAHAHVAKHGGDFDAVFRQIITPEIGGPLKSGKALEYFDQANEWGLYQTYNNPTVVSDTLSRIRNGIREIGRSANPNNNRLIRALFETIDLVYDSLTRYSKVLTNVAADKTTWTNPTFALTRAGLQVAFDMGKHGTIRPVTAKKMGDMIAKGLYGSLFTAIGASVARSYLSDPEPKEPKRFKQFGGLVRTATYDGQLRKRGNTVYIQEGYWGRIDGMLTAFIRGYHRELIDQGYRRGFISESQKKSLEQDLTWFRTLTDIPVVGNLVRAFRAHEPEERFVAKSLAAGLPFGHLREWAERRDIEQNAQPRRKPRDYDAILSKEFVDYLVDIVKTRYPWARETVRPGTDEVFPRVKLQQQKIKLPDFSRSIAN